MAAARLDGPPSIARLLAAGQRGEALDVAPVYGPCRAVEIPGKGRGLVATGHVPAGGLLLLEPALASGASYAELAAAVAGRVQAGGGDGLLLQQLLDLSQWGLPPEATPPLPGQVPTSAAEEDDFLKRRPPSGDAAEFEAARRRLLREAGVDEGADVTVADFEARLLKRLESAARSNAFRSAPDLLGAVAWHSLSAAEQRAVAAADPSKVPEPRLWLFLRGSLFNHSEATNASWLVAGSTIVVRAALPVSPGEELVVSYWPDVDAADAVAFGLAEAFGMGGSSLGPAAELGLTEEQRAHLEALKRAPLGVASRLAAAGSGDVAAAFDAAAAALGADIAQAEKVLPKNLRAFLEPRFFQAQLTLQQAAALMVRGDASSGEKLQQLAIARVRAALKNCEPPWGKRVLLRLLFALKGILRPAPADLLAVAAASASEGAAGGAQDFSIQLAKQARLPAEAVRGELERAVEDAMGDGALLQAVLSKCGLSVAPPSEE